MDEEPAGTLKRYALGDDISRLSIADLEALRTRLLAEAERIAQEVRARGSSRAAADAFFKR